jgi:hypothetical protein
MELIELIKIIVNACGVELKMDSKIAFKEISLHCPGRTIVIINKDQIDEPVQVSHSLH